MARVHSYGRLSAKKKELGDSQRRQDEGLDKFLRAGGHTLSDLRMFDPGRSAFRGNKQKCLNELLAILRKKDGRIAPGDILFVEAVDRLSRKGIRPTQDVVNEILNAGVDIAIALPIEKTYKADKTNDLGDAIELAAFAFAAHVYSDLLSGRLKRFHEGARKRAYTDKKPINSGPVPAWLRRDRVHGFSFRDGAKETIRYIYLRTMEGMGGKTLVKELNAKFPCFGYSGRWNERYMRAILNDRRAMGEYQPFIVDDAGKRQIAGDPIPGYYPAAVTETEWRQANASAANRRIERGPTSDYTNLLTGLVYHALDKCACHLYTYQQKRADGRKVIFRRWKSVKATEGIKGAHTETVDVQDMEEVILHWLKELDTSVFDGRDSRAAELAALVAAMEKKQRRIAEIEEDEESSVALLAKQLAKLRDEMRGLAQQIDALKVTVDNATSTNLDRLKRLATLENTPENRQKLREAIKRVVRRITILPVKPALSAGPPWGTRLKSS